MKRMTLSALTATTAILTAAIGCSAGNDPSPRTATASLNEGDEGAADEGAPDEHGRRGVMDPAAFLERFDADGNGTLEAAELPSFMADRMKGVDANADGHIDATELAAAFERHKQERFARKDTNKDGALTPDEIGKRMWRHLGAADADKDGRLTQNELDEAFKNGALRHHKGRGHGKRGHRMHGGPPSPEKLFEHLDRNGNGTIELAELPEHKREWLATADANDDGTITREEVLAHAEAKGQELFAKIDANGDGFLTADEVPGRRWERLVKADANGDAKLTADELRGAMKNGKMGWKGHKERRGGPDGRPFPPRGRQGLGAPQTN
jgi:Ca2+-binding EF-hand superfamily protein